MTLPVVGVWIQCAVECMYLRNKNAIDIIFIHSESFALYMH